MLELAGCERPLEMKTLIAELSTLAALCLTGLLQADTPLGHEPTSGVIVRGDQKVWFDGNRTRTENHGWLFQVSVTAEGGGWLAFPHLNRVITNAVQRQNVKSYQEQCRANFAFQTTNRVRVVEEEFLGLPCWRYEWAETNIPTAFAAAFDGRLEVRCLFLANPAFPLRMRLGTGGSWNTNVDVREIKLDVPIHPGFSIYRKASRSPGNFRCPGSLSSFCSRKPVVLGNGDGPHSRRTRSPPTGIRLRRFAPMCIVTRMERRSPARPKQSALSTRQPLSSTIQCVLTFGSGVRKLVRTKYLVSAPRSMRRRTRRAAPGSSIIHNSAHFSARLVMGGGEPETNRSGADLGRRMKPMQPLRSFLAAALSVSLLLAVGCRKESEATKPPAPVPAILKIAVLSDGRLLADGEPTSLVALRNALDRVKAQQGVVWYYREGGDQEPPPIAMEVMKAVVDAGLPIRLSSRPDFSDAIGEDGVPAGH